MSKRTLAQQESVFFGATDILRAKMYVSPSVDHIFGMRLVKRPLRTADPHAFRR